MTKKMKKTFALTFIIIGITSCSSIKISCNPINDYIQNIIKNKEPIIYVVNKKISNKKTLGIFKGDFMLDTRTNTYVREGVKSNLYNIEDWDKMSKEYTYDSVPEYWKKRDFKLSNVVIVDNESFINGELYKKTKNKYYSVYAFSNPIYYKKKNFVIFTVINSSTTFGAEPSEFVIVMKKENNKWLVVEKVYEN